MTFRPTALLLLLPLAALALAVPPAARAAQDYDGCTGFIDSLPATVSTPGVWCLRKDLSTPMSSGQAITLGADDVTLDRNDFKLGGLAAGTGASVSGISASGRERATVRRCNVRGFRWGISIGGGSGHLVEDNRLEDSRYVGIMASNVGVVHVRRNRVVDTGGVPENIDFHGIYCDAPAGGVCHVEDNTVDGVAGVSGWYSTAIGIRVPRTMGGRVAGNSVRNLVPTGLGTHARGIYLDPTEGAYTTVSDNRLALGTPVAGSIAIACFGSDTTAGGNAAWGFAFGLSNCIDDGGNASH